MFDNIKKGSWMTVVLPHGVVQRGPVRCGVLENSMGRVARRLGYLLVILAGVCIGCKDSNESIPDASFFGGDSASGTSATNMNEYNVAVDSDTKWNSAADSDTKDSVASDTDTKWNSASDTDTKWNSASDTGAADSDTDNGGETNNETDTHVDGVDTAGSDPDGVGATDSDDAAFESDTGSNDATSDEDTSGDAETDDNDTAVNHDSTGSEGCGAASPTSGDLTIDVQGTTRKYTVKIPSNYDPNTPYKLVFAWHGLGGTASMTARGWFGLESYSDGSAIFIAGQAQSSGSGGMGGMASWAIHPDDSDMDYTRAMVDWAKANYCIDTDRIFSIGVSNGGMMSNIVGCELGDIFRGIATIAGGGPEGYATTPCKGQVAVWITHGNRDDNVPFSYGESSRDYWLGANNCGRESEAATMDVCLEYQGCDDGLPVQFCEHDGGHTVPSFTGEAAWNFFAGL